jgi:hypothetical protein
LFCIIRLSNPSKIDGKNYYNFYSIIAHFSLDLYNSFIHCSTSQKGDGPKPDNCTTFKNHYFFGYASTPTHANPCYARIKHQTVSRIPEEESLKSYLPFG